MGTLTDTSNTWTKASEAVGFMASKTDTFNKAVKVIIPALDIALTILGLIPGVNQVAAGLGMLKGRLNDARSVCDATNILERGYEWTHPKEILSKGWLKTAGRVTLTAAQALETVLFVDKVSIGFLAMSAFTFGGFALFELAKNLIYVVSASFGIAASVGDLQEVKASSHGASMIKKKYIRKEMELGGLDTFDLPKIAARYQVKLDKATTAGEPTDTPKLVRAADYVRFLTEDATEDNFKIRVHDFQKAKVNYWKQKCTAQLKGRNSENLNQQIDQLTTKLKENQNSLKRVKKADAKKVRDEMKTQVQQLSSLKAETVAVKRLETYVKALDNGKARDLASHEIKKCDVRLANANVKKTKTWLSLAVDIAKIVMITLGILVVGVSAFFNPVVALSAGLVMSGLSLVANSIGLVKNLYSDVHLKPSPEPEFVLA